MKDFMNENFLLNSPAAEKLYHEYSRDLPIIDYHCHLPPEHVAEDRIFGNITKVWLNGDHYKWRAMRANGVDEEFITGNAGDREKFIKWAETVPETLRNPLYHWTHLELRRYFGINELLNKDNAGDIYDRLEEMLNKPEFSARNLMKRSNVELVCTTDDPADSLEHHLKLAGEGFDIQVLPTWRPDKAMAIEDPAKYNDYIEQLAKVSGTTIEKPEDLYTALQKRHDFFHETGCRLSDHGIESFYAEDYTEKEIENIFSKVRAGEKPTAEEALKFRSAMLVFFAIQDYEKEWTQQFHFGAIRNNNILMMEKLGPDTGYDSIGDFSVARSMSKFLNILAIKGKLAKTIVYNLNPRDNELVTTMLYNFNDGKTAGKMQFGSGWWFLDQKDGMTRQLNALSSLGLLSRFVGMLTDSRSFLSYPRHEYFRRLLCNLIGEDMEKGEIPYDFDMTGKLVADVSYYNAKNYFGF